MVIWKEDALFKTRLNPNECQFRWISLFSNSSWIQTTVSGLHYEIGLNDVKKVNGNWDIINKNEHSIFHTGKPGNFNSLREVIWIILWHCYLEINWRWESVPKKLLWLLTSFRWNVKGMSLKPLDYQQTLVESYEKLSYKEQVQIQSTETSLCICLWSNNEVLSKFYHLLIFSTCFNQMK